MEKEDREALWMILDRNGPKRTADVIARWVAAYKNGWSFEWYMSDSPIEESTQEASVR